MRVLLRAFRLLGQQSTYVEQRSTVCNGFGVEVSIPRVFQLHAQILLMCRSASEHVVRRHRKCPKHPLIIKVYVCGSCCGCFRSFEQQSTRVEQRSAVCDESSAGVCISRAAPFHAINQLMCSRSAKHAALRSQFSGMQHCTTVLFCV